MSSMTIALALGVLIATSVCTTVSAQDLCPKGQRVESLEKRRAELAKLGNMYLQERSEHGEQEFLKIKREIFELDDHIVSAYYEQALTIFRLTREPRCALGALNKYTGMNFSVQPYTDSTWDLLSNGMVLHPRITDDQLLAFLSRAR